MTCRFLGWAGPSKTTSRAAGVSIFISHLAIGSRRYLLYLPKHQTCRTDKPKGKRGSS